MIEEKPSIPGGMPGVDDALANEGPNVNLEHLAYITDDFPWIMVSDVQRLLRKSDGKFFRSRLRRLGFMPGKNVGPVCLLKLERLPEIIAAFTPAPIRAKAIPQVIKPVKDWAAAAGLVTEWSTRDQVCKICAPALGWSFHTLMFTTSNFDRLKVHLEQDGKRRKYRSKVAPHREAGSLVVRQAPYSMEGEPFKLTNC